MEARL